MIIDGRAIACEIEENLKKAFLGIKKKKVAFVLFADNDASRQFIKMKTNVADRLGIETSTIECFDCLTTDLAIHRIESISQEGFDGIVIQLPIPKSFNSEALLNSVPAQLDIDALGRSTLPAPVASAVWEILKHSNINFENKNIVIVGNGKLVGVPVAKMFSLKQISYMVIDKDTPKEITTISLKNADIIISGAGVPHMIKSHMIKEGAVLIDAGTSEQSGKLVGDIDPLCFKKASYMTPVPGGVGPVTVISLFVNLMKTS
jgi:methylenetetrahydrofolate dehydrogenase (NADP+)/methenyltetrahydrofolate cyclohydrolase